MYDRRMLVLLIEKVQEGDDRFCEAVPLALSEYVEALEKDNVRNRSSNREEAIKPSVVDKPCVEFKTSNGCIIRAVAGGETFFKQ